MEKDGSQANKSLEITVLRKVGDVVSAVAESKNADEVICALYSLGALLFPLDSSLFSGSIAERYRDRLVSIEVASIGERRELWDVFYRGAAFPTLARVLLYDLAASWLGCFPLSGRTHVYDAFFVHGLSTEVLQAVVPCLQHNGSNSLDSKAIRKNAERLLVLCFLENNGVVHMAKEFGNAFKYEDFTAERGKSPISKAAQLVASIPDKAQSGAPAVLSPHMFYKQVTVQLLAGAEESDVESCGKADISDNCTLDGPLLFLGETFARMCRRGSTDVILGVLMPRVLGLVQNLLLAGVLNSEGLIQTRPGSCFWLKLMDTIKDPYAVERLSEQILRQLEIQHVTEEEAYWILWLLFHQTSVRSLFVDKFLLWKVFPVCCLRWILQFAILGCPPGTVLRKGRESCIIMDTVQRLVSVWTKREFVQSASLEQQAYVTAALGLCLEKITKDELDVAKDVMHSVLRGVSCRLESPNALVRRMASCVALVFSKVVDPKNLLYLDDSCTGESVDWEFGLSTIGEKNPPKHALAENGLDSTTKVSDKEISCSDDSVKHAKDGSKKLLEFKVVDPDEVIDLATLNSEPTLDDDEDDNSSEASESSSDSSLQPYDLSDDDIDLRKNISQLVDIVGALRKSDDPDGVERALDVAEKLVRASPDELLHVSGDLARTLVQVRCSELTVEGEEDSAEEKRQKALVALIVTCPFESLDTLNKLLYSPNLDTSQRMLILDVMTDAAEELAAAKIMKFKHQKKPLISAISERQPWFLPSDAGPPGSGSWKEISEKGSLLNYSYRYERELPLKPGLVKRGKSRRWSLKSENIPGSQLTQNSFPLYAAAFMLPAMQNFDKRRHGVDLLGRDFIVLGKLIHMLGVCMKCAAMHPEASSLASPLLDMLSSREICHHTEAYVRRSGLFAASCILVALHPSFVASALTEGNLDICKGLDWIRAWALDVVESDTDKECYMMAMHCLQLHAEMALQASRSLESAESTFRVKGVGPPSKPEFTIKLP